MRSLLKISVICAAIVLLVVYRSDIGSKVSDWWDGVVPQSTSHPLEGSVQIAGAAVNGVMNGVGRAFGR